MERKGERKCLPNLLQFIEVVAVFNERYKIVVTSSVRVILFHHLAYAKLLDDLLIEGVRVA